MRPEDIALSREWAETYIDVGFNPLPSRPDAKRPFCKFREFWESPAPLSLFDKFQTSNIQICCGRFWRLLVIDLDGLEAIREWHEFGNHYKTWTVESGDNGKHLWFRLPQNYHKPLPKAFLWKSKDGKSAIERICDRSLIMAPPSIHPKTGRRYVFAPRLGPKSCGIANCPQWILDLKPLESPRAVPPLPQIQTTRRASTAPRGRRYDANAVLDAIPDKIALARAWGVRIAGGAGRNGWVPCHAIDREDRNPSAAVHNTSGVYVDLGSGTKLSFIGLGIALGAFSDFQDAIQQLGQSVLD